MDSQTAVALALAISLASTAVVYRGDSLEPVRPNQESNLRVAAVGLCLERPGHTHDGGPFELTPLDQQRGERGERLRLALEVQDPRGGLISIDEADSRITMLRDDVGAPLVGALHTGVSTSASGTRIPLTIEAATLPSAGARKVVATGRIAVRRSTGKRRMTTHAVEFEQGTRFEGGGHTFEIEMSEARARDGQWRLSFECDIAPDILCGLAAVTADGVYVSLEQSVCFERGQRFVHSWTGAERLTAGSLTFELHEGTESVYLPFELEVGLGLR